MDNGKDMYKTINDTGDVKIADEVIASIAAIAATEVEGVASIVAGAASDIAASLLGKKTPGRGIKVSLFNNTLTLDIALSVRFGYVIPEVAAKVQQNVLNSEESMTGLKVQAVNLTITSIVFDKPAAPAAALADEEEQVATVTGEASAEAEAPVEAPADGE